MSKQTYLVCGASQGIGSALAKHLSKQYNVIGISRNREKLEHLKSDTIDVEIVDICMQSDIDALFSSIQRKNIKIDGIVNNAGYLINKPFVEQTEEDWFDSFNINVFGVARIIKSLLPILNANAHIVNISSMGGYQGSSKYSGLSSYASSKGALAILTECLAAELNGISINCLCLGAVQTKMLNSAFPDYEAPLGPKEMAEYIGDFLVSGHKYFNGKILPVALSNP